MSNLNGYKEVCKGLRELLEERSTVSLCLDLFSDSKMHRLHKEVCMYKELRLVDGRFFEGEDFSKGEMVRGEMVPVCIVDPPGIDTN